MGPPFCMSAAEVGRWLHRCETVKPFYNRPRELYWAGLFGDTHYRGQEGHSHLGAAGSDHFRQASCGG